MLKALERDGFVVIPGPLEDVVGLAADYDAAVAGASDAEVKVGSATTRVDGLGGVFDAVCDFPPLIEACGAVLGENLRLSTFIARTLRAGGAAQDLHQDYAADERGWTMLGFILMVDAFHEDNGATRFVPGSHRLGRGTAADVAACGAAWSMIVYNGAVWHGHGANRTGEPRRSIQGAYVRK